MGADPKAPSPVVISAQQQMRVTLHISGDLHRGAILHVPSKCQLYQHPRAILL